MGNLGMAFGSLIEEHNGGQARQDYEQLAFGRNNDNEGPKESRFVYTHIITSRA